MTDPQLAAQNLAAAAEQRGAEFRYRTTVIGIDADDGRVRAVRLADGTRIPCRVVVNAAGPWSSRVNELAGVGDDFTIGLRPMRQEVAHVPVPDGSGAADGDGDRVMIADMDLGVYLRGETGGGVLVGGTEPPCDPFHWVDDPDAVDVRPTMPVFQAQVTRAARRLTRLTVPHRPAASSASTTSPTTGRRSTTAPRSTAST